MTQLVQVKKKRCTMTFDTYLATKTKLQVKGNVSYLMGTAISLNLSYLLAVRLAASSTIPFNTHKIKKKKIIAN